MALLIIGEVLSFFLMVGNMGLIENNPYPPLQDYLLAILGLVLIILFAQLIRIESRREEKKKKEKENKKDAA